METYKMFRERQQRELESFPMKHAFNNEEFEKGMKELGLNPEETDKIYKMPDGSYYRKSDAKALSMILSRHQEEFENAIATDETGTQFIFQMFYFELGKHGYPETGDPTAALNALGLTMNMISRKSSLKYGYNLACEKRMNRPA